MGFKMGGQLPARSLRSSPPEAEDHRLDEKSHFVIFRVRVCWREESCQDS